MYDSRRNPWFDCELLSRSQSLQIIRTHHSCHKDEREHSTGGSKRLRGGNEKDLLRRTQTFLIKVSNYPLRAVDSAACAILILLDLSGAFDNTDRDTILHHLEKFIGIKDATLAWFWSHLLDLMSSLSHLWSDQRIFWGLIIILFYYICFPDVRLFISTMGIYNVMLTIQLYCKSYLLVVTHGKF